MLWTFLKDLKQAVSGLSLPHTSQLSGPGTSGTGLASQLDPLASQIDPLLGTSKPEQAADHFEVDGPGRAQVVDELCLHLLGGPRASATGEKLHATLKYHPATPETTQSRGELNSYQSPVKLSPAAWGKLLHS